MTPSRAWLDRNPWVWSFAGALGVWVLTVAVAHGRGGIETLSVAVQFATFYVIVGMGQMLVIAAGPGNIDLSIPGVMTVAGYLSMGVMGGSNGHLLAGLASGIGAGLAVGVANVVLIQGLAIPPMIGTLAAGFVVQSVAIAYSSGSTAKPAPALAHFTTLQVFDVPVIAVVFAFAAAAMAVVMQRSVFGRSVRAVGQNRRAAYLAGLRVERTLAGVYLISAMLAGLAGTLLAAYSGGASLDMGTDYLLMSIAVVVLGGT
ncbi:MAG: ABC transporter permease, partial [Pseudomonadota bacterium]|nr:ABC transporter permease [Pseudomonadota bacterium]